MIPVDILQNLYASAIWELALMPLYRGTVELLRRPGGRRKGAIDEAVRDAARHVAAAYRGRDIDASAWRAFLDRDEVRGVIHDLFLFRMDDQEPSVAEIGVAFGGLWAEYAADTGLHEEAVDIDAVFTAVVEGANQVLDAAIGQHVLAAHEGRSIARHRITQARLDVIERLVRDGGRPKLDDTAIDRFESRLRAEVGLRHAKIEPPSLHGRERIDLDRLYVPPGLERASVVDAAERLSVDEVLRTLNRRVVLGHPGAGKSTLTYEICHRLAARYDDGPVAGRCLTPWRIELRRFAADDTQSRSLLDYFEHWARTSYELDVPDGAFVHLLERGHLLVIFDGLDELLDTSRRRDVRDQVESFCRRFARTPVLVTSRIVGYDDAPLDQDTFDVYRLGDFDEERVALYANKWFAYDGADESEQDRRQRTASFLQESRVAADLRANPLLLALLCSSYRGSGSIPNNLPDVYGNCADLLFNTWDSRRNIKVVLPFSEQIRPALRELAWWIFNDPNLANGVTYHQAVAKTAEYLGRRRFSDAALAEAAARDFIDFCRGRAWVFTDQGLTATGEDLFGFTHRTFMEFFAAERLAYQRETADELVERLLPRVLLNEWDVVVRIALQIKARGYPEGPDDVIMALYRRIRNGSSASIPTGISFLLSLLRAIIPSPVLSQQLGDRTMRLVITRGLQRSKDGRDLQTMLAALSSVGPEVHDEVLTGVVGAIVGLLHGDDVNRRRAAAPIAGGYALVARGSMRMTNATRESPSENAMRPDFWPEVRARLVANHLPELRAAAQSDPGVAPFLAGWAIGPRSLVEAHGSAALFAMRASPLAGFADELSILAGTMVWAPAGKGVLPELADVLLNLPVPWVDRLVSPHTLRLDGVMAVLVVGSRVKLTDDELLVAFLVGVLALALTSAARSERDVERLLDHDLPAGPVRDAVLRYRVDGPDAALETLTAAGLSASGAQRLERWLRSPKPRNLVRIKDRSTR